MRSPVETAPNVKKRGLSGSKLLRIMLRRYKTQSQYNFRCDFRSFARVWELHPTAETAADQIVALGRVSPSLLSHAFLEVYLSARQLGDAKRTISRRFDAVKAFFRVAREHGEDWIDAVSFPTRG